MKGPKQGAPEIFKAMKVTALGSLDATGVLKRLVTTYVMECERNTIAPNREGKTYEEKYERLTAELEKAKTLLAEKPADVERGRKVADLRREMGQVNRDKQAAYRIAEQWGTIGKQITELLRQELGK
jgi:hypothetical protein